MSRSRQPHYVLYLAVLPFYRQQCVEVLQQILGGQVDLLAGSDNIDPTVTTGIDPSRYTLVRNRYLLNRRLLLQTGHWHTAIAAETTILDLNPRNLSVWVLTVVRRILGRRTLHWGHLYPRAGAQSKTGWLRRLLRTLAQGTVLYSYDEAERARCEKPGKPVWVAPNSLYRLEDLYDSSQPALPRTSILYVGRLVNEKKVSLLIAGFALSGLQDRGVTLDIVGSGEQESALRDLAVSLGCDQAVAFSGHVVDVSVLRSHYARAACSVSPGYAGLNLTQSLGFGVPVIVADNEPHSPEIELARFEGVTFFAAGDPTSLAQALTFHTMHSNLLDAGVISKPIKALYSAQAMAQGLHNALENTESLEVALEWSN